MEGGVGFPLDHGGFDPSTLVYWRRRIARSERPYRISDAVRTVIGQTGVLAGCGGGGGLTILADAVATQDTITQLVAAVRRVGREVPGAAEMIAGVCTGMITRRRASRGSTGTTRPPRTRWSALVTDANALVAALKDRELEERAASAVGLLALVAGQDVEPAEGSDGTEGGGGSPGGSPETG